MLTRQAVGVGTAFYDGDSAVQSEVQVAEDEDHHDDAVSYSNDGIIFPLEESHSSNSNGGCPVLFLYDCEATGGSIYKDHIIEIASLVIEPLDISIGVASFSSLCRSSHHICKIG